MSKRVLGILLLCLCSISMTGCGKVMDLTEEESALIAEYAADLLLKYDMNYEDRMEDGDREAAKLAEKEASEKSDLVQPVTEKTTTRTKKKKGNKDEQTEKVTDREAAGDGDLAGVLGLSGVSITVKDYLVADRYPEQSMAVVEADPGRKLLVLRFALKNTGKDAVSVSLMNQDVRYTLSYADGAASAMLTILPEDLGTLDTTVETGASEEVVLVFQVSEDADVSGDMALRVKYNNESNTINIK